MSLKCILFSPCPRKACRRGLREVSLAMLPFHPPAADNRRHHTTESLSLGRTLTISALDRATGGHAWCSPCSPRQHNEVKALYSEPVNLWELTGT